MVNAETTPAQRSEGWARSGWTLVTGCALLLALVACRGGAAEVKETESGDGQAGAETAKAKGEAKMPDTTVTRIGTVELGTVEQERTEEEEKDEAKRSSEKIAQVPVVLWSGTEPVAVLVYRTKDERHRLRWTQSFERVLGQGGPFPVTSHITYKLKEMYLGEESRHDGYIAEHVTTADLNGDGVDELVLVRRMGGIEAYGAAKELFKTSSVAHDLEPKDVHHARAGGKDVLYVRFWHERKEGEAGEAQRGKVDRSVVVRVDASGAKALPLGSAVLRAEVLAVGAVNRPGSKEIDELLVLSTEEVNSKDVYLSRHRPDGQPIGEPRKVYLPISGFDRLKFVFVPQSRRAVVVTDDMQGVYFIEAEKPVNWVRRVYVPEDSKRTTSDLLQVVDPSDPKVIALGGGGLYAFGQEGSYYGWNDGFVPVEGVKPYLELKAPSPKHELVGVVPAQDGSDDLLVVHTRGKSYVQPAPEEVVRAADRFLSRGYMEGSRKELEPKLDNLSPKRDDLIEEEMKNRGISEKPKTIEDWKKKLPDSYAAMVEYRKDLFLEDVMGALEDKPGECDPRLNAPQLAELNAWLAARKVPAETTFDLYRRGRPAVSFRIPAYFNSSGLGLHELGSDLGCPPITFRARGQNVTVVLPLGDKRLHVVRHTEAR